MTDFVVDSDTAKNGIFTTPSGVCGGVALISAVIGVLALLVRVDMVRDRPCLASGTAKETVRPIPTLTV